MDTANRYDIALSQLITIKKRDDGKKNETMEAPAGVK